MTKKHNIRVAFVGFAVPDTTEYVSSGFSRAGNLAQNGFVEALMTSGIGLEHVWSFRSGSYFPNRKFFYAPKYESLSNGSIAYLPAELNIFPFRDCFRHIYVLYALVKWVICTLGYRRVLVSYNTSFPNIWFLRLATWLTRTRLLTIVYEATLITGEKQNLLHRLLEPAWYRALRNKMLPYLDGRVFITDAIARDFCPRQHYIRIDGGVTNEVVMRLFPLEIDAKKRTFDLVFAGDIAKWNMISVMLAFMKSNLDANLRLHIAGQGEMLPEIMKVANEDARVVYHGMLNHDELFKLYAKADVLLNLRDASLEYHYPSKLLEILTLGKIVVTTNPSHTKETYGHICFVLDGGADGILPQFASAIEKIRKMSPVERYTFGRHAREWMLANKTWYAQGPALRDYIETKVV